MRLIDADALMEKQYNASPIKALQFVDMVVAVGDIDEAPTVDAGPVVRCRDCVYWQDNNGGYPHEECRWGKDETPDADDFCSYGERKDGDG